ncbi:MAG: hypothetical protein ACLT9P_09700 [Evtepia gabavorous]
MASDQQGDRAPGVESFRGASCPRPSRKGLQQGVLKSAGQAKQQADLGVGELLVQQTWPLEKEKAKMQ